MIRTIDDIANELYDTSVVFSPLPNGESMVCPVCKTKLKVYYAENRLYVIKCVYCNNISLTKASNPIEACKNIGAETEIIRTDYFSR